MNDIDMITLVFVYVDDLFKAIKLDPKTGPNGTLTESEIVTIMIMHPILKPYWDLKSYYKWVINNLSSLFPDMPDYTRITRLFLSNRELVLVVMKSLCNQNSFGLIADGTCIPVMERVRGKYAKSFRDARFVYSASKKEWYWGFLLILVLDQEGKIAFLNIGIQAEVKQLETICEDLSNRWVLSDLGFIGKDLHERLWKDNQIKIKITGGKERQWIENVIGFLKDKLGLDQIRKIRKTPSLLARIYSMLCAYNLIQSLVLAN